MTLLPHFILQVGTGAFVKTSGVSYIYNSKLQYFCLMNPLEYDLSVKRAL